MIEGILIRGARLHNLKNITLSIPKNKLVVFTGLSGSGKSTLGFDILYQEGQRQYLEALGLVPFGVSKPPVDSISGLSPTISVDQHLTNHSPRSTVGTVTEIYTYLRVLFARLGHRPCPACGQNIGPVFSSSIVEWADDDSLVDDRQVLGESIPCPHCGAAIPEMTMAHFSFNKPEGACPTCTGLGSLHRANLKRLIDEQKSIAEGAVFGWEGNFLKYNLAVLEAAARHYRILLDPSRPVKDFSEPARDLLYYGVENPLFRRHCPDAEPPATVRQGRFEGIATNLLRRYAERIQDTEYREKLEEQMVIQICPECGGTRLRAESRAVTVQGETIVAVSGLPLVDLAHWVHSVPEQLSSDELRIARPILDDVIVRIERVIEAGAGYLALERAAPTLSAGESQRLRLASLLGSGLSGVLYVFDEPTIGLHQRDTDRLIQLLRRLRNLGNTVLVIEHDLQVIRGADHVVDFGPGAGKNGGQIVAVGTPAEIVEQPDSLTGNYLSGRMVLPAPKQRRKPGEHAITIRGARHHNLQNINIRFPLGLLIAVTGVSGSGKSSLVFDILDRFLRQQLYGAAEVPGNCDAVDGWDSLDRVITVDQAHLTRIPRSNAATYSDTFTAIREAFAATPQAKHLGFTARQFSFNVPGGRCEHCQGAGIVAVKMHFLPDVEVRCPACQGRRFTRETLAVQYQGVDIGQVLDMTVDEAWLLFQDVPAAAARLKLLADVGLGYLQLGQPATTLSGGEAQRVKLAKELGRRNFGRTLYLLDEPTTGLHLADTARLLAVLQRLVDASSTVIVVEHNLELVKAADWVIDLGPEGGAGGGRLIAEGTPEEIARTADSFTGQWLRKIL